MGRDTGGRRDLQRAEDRIRRALRSPRPPPLLTAAELLWIAAHAAREVESLLDGRLPALAEAEKEARVHALSMAAVRALEREEGRGFLDEVLARLQRERAGADPLAADLAEALAGAEAARLGALVFLRTFTRPLVGDPLDQREVLGLGSRGRWRPLDLGPYAAFLHWRGDRIAAARVAAAIAALPRRGIPALWRRAEPGAAAAAPAEPAA